MVDLSSRNPDWWRQAVIYQVYPRSFADADGDGLGDLRGITERLSHLAGLGVDALWLSPFYPSELADGGYDVADHRNVDPRLGTLDDFDAMVAEAHRLGLKVIVDIVPNHTSHLHLWFREALLSGPGSAARERFVFRPGRGAHGELPPSDWQSVFGGSAWRRVPDGEWYLHLFAPEQPDLNWEHEEVRADFRTTLRFWSDRGVDGFRVDVAHALMKDLAEPLRDVAEFGAVGEEALERVPPGTHPYWDRDEVHEIYRDWRKIFDSYSPPRTAVAEAWVPNARRALYARPDGLGQAFNFEYLQTPWDAEALREVITGSLAAAHAAGASATWVLSNHDVVRHASRLMLPPGTDENAWLLSGGRTPARHRPPGPDLGTDRPCPQGPRRLPGAAAVDGGGSVVRLRGRRLLAAAAGVVRVIRRRGPGRYGGLHPGALPHRPAAAPQAGRGRDADLGRGARGRAALRPDGGLAVCHERVGRARAAAAGRGAAGEHAAAA